MRGASVRYVSAQTLGATTHPSVAQKLWLTVEICALRVSAFTLLRRHPDARDAVDALRRRVAAPVRPDDDVATARLIDRLSWASRAVLEQLPGDHRCLAQSLVLTALLSRRGVDSKVVIGVRKDRQGGALDAHAWVTVHGRAVSPAGDHARLAEL